MRVPVANTAPREACSCGQRSPSEEMPEACALESPVGVGAAGRIARDSQAVATSHGAAPTRCRLLGCVTDRDPLDFRRSLCSLSQHLHHALGKRTPCVTQKRDDRGAVWLECKRQARCAIARTRRREHLQRARSQERSRVHAREGKRLGAPAVVPERRAGPSMRIEQSRSRVSRNSSGAALTASRACCWTQCPPPGMTICRNDQ